MRIAEFEVVEWMSQIAPLRRIGEIGIIKRIGEIEIDGGSCLVMCIMGAVVSIVIGCKILETVWPSNVITDDSKTEWTTKQEAYGVSRIQHSDGTEVICIRGYGCVLVHGRNAEKQ